VRGVGRVREGLWIAVTVGCVTVTAVALRAQGGAPPAGGQRPPGATGAPAAQERNLQILPKDISRQELGEIMQGFARSLGVGCDHCHMGESMEAMDWANDDKDAKKDAREMMRLVGTINERLSGLSKTDHTRAQVGCETCHRGLAVPPRPLGDILAEKALAGGPDAALAEYNRLHVEAGDAGQYDFRERALNTAARRLRDEKRLPDAVALLRKNASLFPRSAEVAAMLGSMLAESGEVEAGRAELQRALELDPSNRAAKGALGRLTGAGKPPAP
jgi:tetratricopeptide (TPR) repeat protein